MLHGYFFCLSIKSVIVFNNMDVGGGLLKKYVVFILGGVVGIINGLLGAGGGMVAVPLLEYSGLEAKKAHATSIGIILPLSIISSGIYYYNGIFEISDVIYYVPAGIIGAIVGSILLKKMSVNVISKVFGALLIYSGVRMMFR